MAQNLQNHHVSICAKRKFLSISTRKKVMIEKSESNIWSNLARMSERFQISDRAAAAIANSVMQDLGLITDDDKTTLLIVASFEESENDAVLKLGKRSKKISS